MISAAAAVVVLAVAVLRVAVFVAVFAAAVFLAGAAFFAAVLRGHRLRRLPAALLGEQLGGPLEGDRLDRVVLAQRRVASSRR